MTVDPHGISDRLRHDLVLGLLAQDKAAPYSIIGEGDICWPKSCSPIQFTFAGKECVICLDDASEAEVGAASNGDVFTVGTGFDVRVPSNQTPKFPDCCVVCGLSAAEETVMLRANPAGQRHALLIWLLGRTHRILIPAHWTCGRHLRRSLFRRNIVIATPLLLAIGVAKPLGWINIWHFLIMVVGIIIPILWWQVSYPIPAEFTYRQDEGYIFTFRDRRYAMVFADLNGVTVGNHRRRGTERDAR